MLQGQGSKFQPKKHFLIVLKIDLQYLSLDTELIITNLNLILQKVMILTLPGHFLNFSPKTHFLKDLKYIFCGHFSHNFRNSWFDMNQI